MNKIRFFSLSCPKFRYLDELVRDMRLLDAVQAGHEVKFNHTVAILAREIERVWDTVYSQTVQDHASDPHNV